MPFLLKRIAIICLLLPTIGSAQQISQLYWSNYACDGYLYHFDLKQKTYSIYTRLAVKDKRNGEYMSYQLSTGKLDQDSEMRYSLTGNDLIGDTYVDFSNLEQAVFNSTQFGRTVLVQCDASAAEQLIREAEKHFQSCPKNTLNCKSF